MWGQVYCAPFCGPVEAALLDEKRAEQRLALIQGNNTGKM